MFSYTAVKEGSMMGMYVGPAPITSDDVLAVLCSAPYRERGMRWTIGKDVWPQILNLKDAEGRWLIDRNQFLGTAIPVTLWGYPIFTPDDEPDALRFGWP